MPGVYLGKIFGIHPLYPKELRSYPETNVFAPENRPGPKRKRWYSNHPFSGAKMLVTLPPTRVGKPNPGQVCERYIGTHLKESTQPKGEESPLGSSGGLFNKYHIYIYTLHNIYIIYDI